jgi:ADP-ribose pyrophosphatase YjhB (NUDIX family)
MTTTSPSILCNVSTNAIIVWQNKILLVRLNRPENKRGLWSLPGGKVDQGETFNSGLEREILEETGISKENYSYSRVAILQDFPETTCKHIFIVNLNNEINTFSFDKNEIMEIKFFELDLVTLTELPFRNDWVFPVIRDYLEGKLNKALYTINEKQ